VTEILTPAQRKLLSAIGRSPIRDDFYLTGGMALSEFHLRHRRSSHLGFSTEDPLAVIRVGLQMSTLAAQLNATIRFGRSLRSFLQCWVRLEDGHEILVDFAHVTTGRLKPVTADPENGVCVDSLADMAANRFSALCDRSDGKDFVDVFFLHREYRPLTDLVGLCRRKHPGADHYGIAGAFRRVAEISSWPTMVRPLDHGELKAFFLAEAAKRIGR